MMKYPFPTSLISENNVAPLSSESVKFHLFGKRILLLALGICFSLFVNAQVSKSLNVTVGSLSTALTANELQTVTDLALTGTIDARDFKTMRDLMPALAEINIREVSIDAYSGEEGTVLYPLNFPANTLPDYAFIDKNTWKGKTNLTSILLPESISGLGVYCFYRCSGLTSIVIPSSVTSIGSYAFDGCSSLATVSIPPSVTSIGIYAFGKCSKLSSVVIPSSVTSIGEGTFSYCSSLTSFVIPSSVNSIGEAAFAKCDYLTSITIPSSVTLIGVGAFISCRSLSSITIPASVTSIGDRAFIGCTRLSSILIPASVTSIGFRVFEACRALIEVDENNQNYSSLDGVLYDKAQTTLIVCSISKVGSVTIPPTVTTINDNAFKRCAEVTAVTIPTSVTSIGEEAFYSCDITSIVIPPSVTSIAKSTFMNCTSLKSIIIPSSVISIGDNAFLNCNQLTSIVVANPIPVNLTSATQDFVNVFEDVSKTTCTLYVPVGSKSAYQAAKGWKDFTKIVEDPKIPTGLEPIINEKQLTAYPNPTMGRVKLILDQIPQNETYLTVTNVTGRMILKQIIRNKEEWIDFSGNPPGVYLIKTNLENFKVQKVILK